MTVVRSNAIELKSSFRSKCLKKANEKRKFAITPFSPVESRAILTGEAVV
jgi:hypothetical protein